MADHHLHELVRILTSTMSPVQDERQNAERSLAALAQGAATENNYLPMLLTIATAGDLDDAVRSAAATTLKNVVKSGWDPAHADHTVHETQKHVLRSHIVQATLSCAGSIRKSLIEVIARMAVVDFPVVWPGVVNELVAVLSALPNDPHDVAAVDRLAGALRICHCVFERYRAIGSLEDEAVAAELRSLNSVFTEPLLHTMQFLLLGIGGVASAAGFDGLLAAAEVFYDVTFLDLGDEHDTHYAAFMNALHACLEIRAPSPALSEELLEVRCAVLSVLTLHLERFDEDISKHVHIFVHVVWARLQEACAPHGEGEDELAISALDFLSAVCRSAKAELLVGAELLNTICEHVILPSIALSEDDVSTFEHEPDQFIARDVEGSDAHTKRASACEFVRALLSRFSDKYLPLFEGYVNTLLQNGGWLQKDAAIYLMSALAIKGSSSLQRGVAALNEKVPVAHFFEACILPELNDVAPIAAHDTRRHAVLKADAIRFVATFRHFLVMTHFSAIFEKLAFWVSSPSVVIHTYAAHAIDRLVSMQDGRVIRIPATVVGPVMLPMLESLCGRLAADRRPNEYCMRALLRVSLSYQDLASPFIPGIFPVLAKNVNDAAKNPSNPVYNHCMFEMLSFCIRFATSEYSAYIESEIWPTLMGILKEDVTAFLPYTLQIFAQLLESRRQLSSSVAGASAGGSNPAIPEAYMQLFPTLLAPGIYEDRGNIPAIVRFLRAFLRCGPSQLDGNNHGVVKLLGIFQLLLSMKQHDHDGFALLCALETHLPREKIDQNIPEILRLIFSRQQSSPTPKFIKGEISYFSLLATHRGIAFVQQAMDSVQAGLSNMVLDRVWIPNAHLLFGAVERKLCLIAFFLFLQQNVNVAAALPMCTRLLVAMATMMVKHHASLGAATTTMAASEATASASASTASAPIGAGSGFREVTGVVDHDEKFTNVFRPLHFAESPMDDPASDSTVEAVFAQAIGLAVQSPFAAQFGAALSAVEMPPQVRSALGLA